MNIKGTWGFSFFEQCYWAFSAFVSFYHLYMLASYSKKKQKNKINTIYRFSYTLIMQPMNTWILCGLLCTSRHVCIFLPEVAQYWAGMLVFHSGSLASQILGLCHIHAWKSSIKHHFSLKQFRGEPGDDSSAGRFLTNFLTYNGCKAWKQTWKGEICFPPTLLPGLGSLLPQLSGEAVQLVRQNVAWISASSLAKRHRKNQG